MAEISIPVQPAGSAVPGAIPPPPLQLKMFSAVDSSGNAVLIQGMCLVDDQGRPYVPLTEATGQQMVKLLGHLIRTIVDNGQGGMYPPDECGLSGQ